MADALTLVVSTGQKTTTERAARVGLPFCTLDADALVLAQTRDFHLGPARGTRLLHLLELHCLIVEQMLQHNTTQILTCDQPLI